MNKFLFLLFGYLSFSNISNGQLPSRNESNYSKSSFYFECGGIGGALFSVNYDKILKIWNNSYLNYDIGIGYNPKFGKYHSMFGVPAMMCYTSGLKNNHLEVGIGLVYSYGFFFSEEIRYGMIRQTNTTYHHSIMNNFRIGYKYQSLNGGMFFRIGFTPYYWLYMSNKYNHPRFIPGFGIGIGYSPLIKTKPSP